MASSKTFESETALMRNQQAFQYILLKRINTACTIKQKKERF